MDDISAVGGTLISMKRSSHLSTAAVIATASIFGLTYSLTAPLIALQLAQRGYGEFYIRLNAAMHAVGVSVVLVRLLWSWHLLHWQHYRTNARKRSDRGGSSNDSTSFNCFGAVVSDIAQGAFRWIRPSVRLDVLLLRRRVHHLKQLRERFPINERKQ